MQVTELFRSIQGEGPLAGRSAVFLRLAGCNLAENCPLNCDTKYAWKEPGKEMKPAEVAEKLTSLRGKNDLLVITGGEPLLQEEEIRYLFEEEWEGKENEFEARIVETNGTLLPYEDWADYWSVSPHTPIDFSQWKQLENVYWKFVCNDLESIKRINEIVQRENLAPRNVWLMPEGYTSKDLNAKRRLVVEKALEHGFNYTDRLHILTWGNERGK